MFSRENDNIYFYLEFVAIKFTYKLHILKFYSGIFAHSDIYPYRGSYDTTRWEFETHQNGLRLPHILLPIIYLAIFHETLIKTEIYFCYDAGVWKEFYR